MHPTGSALVLRVWRTRENFDRVQLSTETSGTERDRLRFCKASASRGIAMSFQITILNVLAGHPGGHVAAFLLKTVSRADCHGSRHSTWHSLARSIAG